MDVKNLGSVNISVSDAAGTETGGTKSGKSKEAQQVSAESLASQSVVISLSNRHRNEGTELRDRVNSAIATTNVATEAATRIDSFVSSIEGLVDQASSDEVTPERVEKLQREAIDLIQAIRKDSQVEGPSGARPLSGDEIRLEIEAELGPTLEFLLPSGAEDAYGLLGLSLTPKEAIINTRASVAEAKERVKALRTSLADASEKIKLSVESLDTAIQNQESANPSLRDVDTAINSAGSARLKIVSQPTQAFASIGEIGSGVLELLGS